ncbi:MAG: Bacitracin export ATP-binding protein BceA [Candidatus Heimdallarchaeota archaeon AB_125]|nr:MAG: Bacitracin export ATP-binding protein BceA [Candidatus Heimdallarchaeota archaeon AB_125]
MMITKDLIKVYHDPLTDVKVSALRGLDLYVKEGEVASIIGPSGSGKSTLIKILSGLEKPSGGTIFVDEINIANLGEKQMREFRYYRMGIINQFVGQNLLSSLTLEKNILLPMRMRYTAKERAKKETNELIKMLNLEKIRMNPITKVSGGEAVRASIGVAIAKKPRILLADEPTGQLDTANTNDIIETFRDLNENYGTTILVVTHDLRFRNAFKKSYIIRDGRLVGVNTDLDRSELEFIIRPQESTLQSIIDSSQFVRVPDEVYISGNYKHIAEFDIHPSKKFSVVFNPDEVNADEVYEIMKETEDDKLDEHINSNNKRAKVSFSEVQPILEQQFDYPKKSKEIIRVEHLSKSFPAGRMKNDVLKDLSFNINKGDFVVISGKSGAGKTTLINVVSGVEEPDNGEIKIKNFDIVKGDTIEIANFRFHEIAMISQVNNLFNQYTVEENMFIPRLFNDQTDNLYEGIEEIARNVEIDHKITSYAAELSAGERQRAALSVALARKATIIFADEPSANLDSRLARNIVTLLIETAAKYGTTIIMSTHDLSLVRPGFRLIRLQDGRIIDDLRVTQNNLRGIIEDYLGVEIADN